MKWLILLSGIAANASASVLVKFCLLYTSDAADE